MILKPLHNSRFFALKMLLFISLTLIQQTLKGLNADSIKVHFSFLNSQHILNTDSSYTLSSNKKLLLSKFKFYVSNIQLDQEGHSSTVDRAIYLIDFSKPEANVITMNKEFSGSETISFDIGIDSIGNSYGAKSGSLDPVNGMYWTWQSGFINAKIEGSMAHDSSLQNFQYHIGGYSYPNNTLQHCQFPLAKTAEATINIDLIEFFNTIDASAGMQLMSPGPKAVQVSKLFSKCFHIQQP